MVNSKWPCPVLNNWVEIHYENYLYLCFNLVLVEISQTLPTPNIELDLLNLPKAWNDLPPKACIKCSLTVASPKYKCKDAYKRGPLEWEIIVLLNFFQFADYIHNFTFFRVSVLFFFSATGGRVFFFFERPIEFNLSRFMISRDDLLRFCKMPSIIVIFSGLG